ncbi:MAG: type I-C CRISPR-associated protein Cas7/Csd2 [Coriobacteriia bacterium]|nr:type I-C CRISPR-associated protein Cas7/Csd2 [Coriobacteriia bacterium]
MSNEVVNDPGRRHDFVLMFEVIDGNPNGDPDAGNMPRLDPETNQGLVTDVCLKRKIRDYVAVTQDGVAGRRIYVQDTGIALETLHAEGRRAAGLEPGEKLPRADESKVVGYMCESFYDVRMFGAVMSTKINAGQVRGPVQLTFARSVDPIFPMDVSITRVAIIKEKDAEVITAEDGSSEGKGKRTEMGRKSIVPYGLYVGHGFYSAPFGQRTGVSPDDLALLWEAMLGMWDLDHSASRGMMACRGLYVFSHDDRLGRVPAQDLFGLVSVARTNTDSAARSFADYVVSVDEAAIPDGVTLTRLIDRSAMAA